MKKAKLLALLVCLGLSVSTFATACDALDGLLGVESSSESVASEQQTSSLEQSEKESVPASSLPETESESNVEVESASDVESESASDVESESTSEEESSSEEEPTVYSVDFVVDGEVLETRYYTEEDLTLIAPEVPAKDGYTGRWEAYELNLTNIIVNAVYEAITYTVTFNVDGVDAVTFTVETIEDVVFPTVPQEEGWLTSWSIGAEDLTLADVTVELVKERLYTINFEGVAGYDSVVLPESALASATLPDAPTKDGYVTGWSEPAIDAENATITFTYWEMTEQAYYTRDIKGADMVHAIKPLWENNQVVWDEDAQAYHLINNNGVDDQRGFVFDQEYFAKMVENGLYSISFEVKLDSVKEGEVIYKGFYPNWWGQMGVDMWQVYGAQDWITLTYNVSDIPTAEGVMKQIFLLADQGSGMWIRNIDVWAPDVNNLTLEDLARSFTPHAAAPGSSVTWNNEDGTILFNVDEQAVAEQTDKRGFVMNQYVFDALRAKGTHVEFSVKFLGERGNDGSLYVSSTTGADATGAYGWWGYHTGIGYNANDWVNVSVPMTKDVERTLFLLCASGNFMVKDFRIAKYHEVMDLPANLSNLTEEHIASAFVPKNQSKNSVVWDATEGAWLFTNTVTSQDNNRAFLLDQAYYQALKTMGTGTITFKVKFLGEHVPGVDNSLYVSYATNSGDWGDWYGSHHQQVAYSSDWVTVTTTLSSEEGRSLFLLCASGSFYLKDICFVTPSQLTSVYEFNPAPADVKVDGLNSNAASEWTVVNDAPEGVDGTALKAKKTINYPGGAFSFDAYDGALLDSYYLSFRIYAAADVATFDLWFYNPDHTEHAGNGCHVQKTNIATNQWVDVTMSLAEVMALLDANNGFTGFQFGVFGANLNSFYVDSLSIVTVVDPADIPLFNKNVSNGNER